ncbi:MAG: TonB family protein [Spirochaetes bacterium]|nr:TonB family protein [Spirochaetota bacterium]
MLTRNTSKILKLCIDPNKCFKTMLIISFIVHMAFLVKLPHSKSMSDQIILDSKKADVTLINFTQIQLKWEEVEPVVKIKSDAGEIPSLFKKKKRKIKPKEKPKPVNVSLSAESVIARETYETRILKRIHRMKYYPRFAKRMGKEGIVGLKFTLQKNGALKGCVELVKKCGHEILNEAGITTIKSASPFPGFPEEVSKERDEMTFIVNVEYNLRIDGI